MPLSVEQSTPINARAAVITATVTIRVAGFVIIVGEFRRFDHTVTVAGRIGVYAVITTHRIRHVTYYATHVAIGHYATILYFEAATTPIWLTTLELVTGRSRRYELANSQLE